jgi:hypothetical protein
MRVVDPAGKAWPAVTLPELSYRQAVAGRAGSVAARLDVSQSQLAFKVGAPAFDHQVVQEGAPRVIRHDGAARGTPRAEVGDTAGRTPVHCITEAEMPEGVTTPALQPAIAQDGAVVVGSHGDLGSAA